MRSVCGCALHRNGLTAELVRIHAIRRIILKNMRLGISGAELRYPSIRTKHGEAAACIRDQCKRIFWRKRDSSSTEPIRLRGSEIKNKRSSGSCHLFRRPASLPCCDANSPSPEGTWNDPKGSGHSSPRLASPQITHPALVQKTASCRGFIRHANNDQRLRNGGDPQQVGK